MNDFDDLPIRLPSGTKVIVRLPRPFTLDDAVHMMNFLEAYIEEEVKQNTNNERKEDVMDIKEMRLAGAKMANTMYNLAQRAGEVIDSDLAAKFDTMRKEWDAAVRATRPSPSTAPTDEAGERAAFEVWAQGRVTSLIKGKFGTGYVYADAARAWDAWQARASLAAKPAKE